MKRSEVVTCGIALFALLVSILSLCLQFRKPNEFQAAVEGVLLNLQSRYVMNVTLVNSGKRTNAVKLCMIFGKDKTFKDFITDNEKLRIAVQPGGIEILELASANSIDSILRTWNDDTLVEYHIGLQSETTTDKGEHVLHWQYVGTTSVDERDDVRHRSIRPTINLLSPSD